MKLSYRLALVPLVAVALAAPADAAKHRKPGKPKPIATAAATPTVTAPMLPPPPAQVSLSLFEALAVAYETNPQLAAAQAGLRATDETVAIANGGWRPTITAGGTYAYQQYRSGAPGAFVVDGHPLQGAITITQPIFRGGRTYAQIGRAKALVRAGRAQLLAAEQTVLLAAATAYMDVVRDEAILSLRRHNVEVLQKQADAVQAQFNAGALTRTDVAQSQARLAAAQSDLTGALSQLAVSRANFLQHIGRAPEALEQEPMLPPALPTSVDDSIVIALKQNPSIVQARENEIATNYAVYDALGAMLPTFSIQGQLGSSQGAVGSVFGAAPIQSATVTGQLNIPLYQAGVEHAAVRQAKELHAQAQLNVSVADRAVRDAVAIAWAQFEAAEASIASYEAAVRANTIAFEGVQKEQQVGSRTILDVLNAEQELLISSVALVSAKRNAEVAAFAVLAASGALTAKSLGLKVKLYDPIEHYESDADAFLGISGSDQ